MPTHLSGKTKEWAWGNFTTFSGSLNTLFGMVSKHDLLQYSINGATSLCRVIGFGKTTLNQHAAFAQPLEQVTAQQWSLRVDVVVIVPDHVFLGVVADFMLGDNFCPLLHVF